MEISCPAAILARRTSKYLLGSISTWVLCYRVFCDSRQLRLIGKLSAGLARVLVGGAVHPGPGLELVVGPVGFVRQEGARIASGGIFFVVLVVARPHLHDREGSWGTGPARECVVECGCKSKRRAFRVALVAHRTL